MRKITFLLIIVVSATFVESQEITVKLDEKIATISPQFWGANFLYWIDDDQSLANEKLATLLKNMPCNVLRYPGGTVADNFHWETAALDNINLFPYESGPEKTNFEEFMSFCQKVGAEPMLVVNTQSWYLAGKIDDGAKEAANWVKYCKQKGYNVRYWEIGNETYWHPYMTAKEYGSVVLKYAKAMKQVDKDIIVSANGHWDINLVGTKERTDSTKLNEIINSAKHIDSPEMAKNHKYMEKLYLEQDNTKGNEKWWNNVLDVCGEEIDMLSIHWYYHQNKLVEIESKLNELKSFVSKKMNGKQYKWCLSEYNCNTSDDASRVVGLVEGIGHFLNVGFDVATFWPMRIGGMEQRSMFSLKDMNPQYPYQIFKIFSKELKGNMVKCVSKENIIAFASTSAANNQITILISGSTIINDTTIKIIIPGLDLKTRHIAVNSYAVESLTKKNIGLTEKTNEFEINSDKISTSIHPDSFVIILITNK